MSKPHLGTTRNQEEERLERDRYIVLVHVYTATWGQATGLTMDRIIQDLGLGRDRGTFLIRSLMGADYLQYAATGEGVVLTRRGVDYIEHAARRRHSLRMVH